MLVLLISVIALGAPVSVLAAVGVLAVTGGVLLVRGVGTDAVDVTSLVLALGVGACIAGYTLVDDHGIRHANAIPYFEIVIAALARSRTRSRSARDGSSPPSNRRSLPAGVAMTAAYLLVLAALERAEAAPVAALRETSVVMAAAAPVLGHEKVPAQTHRRRSPRDPRRRGDRAGLTKGRRRCRPAPRSPSAPAGSVFIRRGGTFRSIRTTCPRLSSQIRSSGKRIVNVWIERHAGMCSAVVVGHLVEPREPLQARSARVRLGDRAARPAVLARAANPAAGTQPMQNSQPPPPLPPPPPVVTGGW